MPPKSRKRKVESDSPEPPKISKDESQQIIQSLIQSRTSNYASFTEQIQRNDKLGPLDEWRNEFPAVLKKRYSSSKDLHITKDELTKLMDWKLQKGKFRPTLPKLIAQNSEESVVEASTKGFKTMLSYKDSKDKSKQTYLKAVKTAIQELSVLRGVGPATASLILSCLSKITATAPPFFSDECAEYVFGKLRGGLENVRKLKYSIGEYMEFTKWWVDLLYPEFEHDMTTLEQGAWCEVMLEKGSVYPDEPSTKKQKV